jgi:hypothetical protein
MSEVEWGIYCRRCPIHRAFCDGWDVSRHPAMKPLPLHFCCHPRGACSERNRMGDLLSLLPLLALLHQPPSNGCPIHRAFCDGWDVGRSPVATPLLLPLLLSSPKSLPLSQGRMGDLLLSLFVLLPHQRIVISTEAAHALCERRSGETTAFRLCLRVSAFVLLLSLQLGRARL